MRRWSIALVLALLACSLGAQTRAGAVEVAGDQALFTAVGTLSGANAYTTYMALGSAADSYASRVYGADKAIRVVGILRTLARSAADGLDALLDTPALHAQDRAYVRGMLEAYGYLVAQADGFEAWVKTGERAQFDRARDQAWDAIGRALIASTGVRADDEEALE